jgi:TRIAP1/MDM35 family protein
MSGEGHSNNELGKMPSMSGECTAAKHRYDDCFNKWFEDYLGLSKITGSSGSSTTGSISGNSSKNSFWSSSSTTSSSTKQNPIDSIQTGPQRTQVERKALRERLDGECGTFWKEYQSCVLVSILKMLLKLALYDC